TAAPSDKATASHSAVRKERFSVCIGAIMRKIAHACSRTHDSGLSRAKNAMPDRKHDAIHPH
ncbi:MAG: hypothetical protein AB7V41_09310, partial [Burkholderiaceae bacterium]